MQDFAIYYTTSDGIAITPKMDGVVENRYENGQGIIWLDGLIISDVFKDCKNLESIIIPEGFTSIGYSAFSNCGLTSIDLPESLTSIEDYAFNSCSKLTSITIPDGITEFGVRVFEDCLQLTSFSGKYASSDQRCLIMNGILMAFAPSGLTAYTIPDGVTTIKSYAFYNCSNLESITLPGSVTTIGEYAFCDCSDLSSITLPEGLEKIGTYAFSNCSNLRSITIPDGVTKIDKYVFSKCSSLSNITLPESLEIIGVYAFNGCRNLSSITLPESLTTIGQYAFNSCSNLRSITIPKGVTGMSTPFMACTSLSDIYCRSQTPPTLSGTLGFGYPLIFYTIHVPRGSEGYYRTAEGWSFYSSIIEGDL